MLSAHVGDLELDQRYRSFVCHVPSGRRFKHRAAFKLLTHHPHEVMFPREARAMWMGMDRFRKWLKATGSTVTVVHMGKGTVRYRLVVKGEDHASDH